MNAPTPTRPINVPTLTEIIEPDAGLPAPPMLSEPAMRQAPLSFPSHPVDGADVEGAVDVASMSPAADIADMADVPRNLLRSTAMPAFAPEPTLPPPMSARVALPPAAHAPTSAALEAARASLSDALRSARDGRWAPMPNVELPVLDMPVEVAPVAPAQAPVDGPQTAHVPEAADAPTQASAIPAPHEVTEVSEAQLSQRVLGVVQKQIDGMIDFRLREALNPILQRHADALVRELRDELKQTMQDVVSRAVSQEMAKIRHR